MVPCKHFSAVTTALALALYGALQRSLREVYAALNPTKIRGDSTRVGLGPSLDRDRLGALRRRARVAVRVVLAPDRDQREGCVGIDLHCACRGCASEVER